jgi:hypothetical protein
VFVLTMNKSERRNKNIFFLKKNSILLRVLYLTRNFNAQERKRKERKKEEEIEQKQSSTV